MLASLFVVVVAVRGNDDMPIRYFPPAAFDPTNEDSNTFRSNHVSKQLIAFGEESFLDQKSLDTSDYKCRMLWLATNGHPICINITKRNGACELHVLQHDGHPGVLENSPKIIIDRRLKLHEQEVKNIEKLLDNANVWTTPVIEKRDGQADGDSIIFEATKEKKYSLSQVSGSSIKANELLLYQKMMELSGKDIVKQWNFYRKGSE